MWQAWRCTAQIPLQESIHCPTAASTLSWQPSGVNVFRLLALLSWGHHALLEVTPSDDWAKWWCTGLAISDWCVTPLLSHLYSKRPLRACREFYQVHGTVWGPPSWIQLPLSFPFTDLRSALQSVSFPCPFPLSFPLTFHKCYPSKNCLPWKLYYL